MLPPSGNVVSKAVADLIISHWKTSNQREADVSRIAGLFATSEKSVHRVVTAWQADGTIREPHQGQSKRSDPRHVFAGKKGPYNLLVLERAEAAGPCDDFTEEVRRRYFEMGGGGDPSLRTVQDALLNGLNMTSKVLSKRARERDSAKCDAWIALMTNKYTSDQLVFIDETSAPPQLSSPLPYPRVLTQRSPFAHARALTQTRR